MQELIDSYLRAYKGRLKPSTFVDYRSILQHHLAPFSSLEALNKGLEDYLSDLPITGKRKNNILSATRSFVNWTKRRELWDGKFLEIPRFSSRTHKIKPLSPEETRLIITYAPEPYKDFYQFGLLTGARTGEALGLQFDDFNFKEGTISIKRALTVGQIVTTKSEAGEREIPLLRPLRELYQKRSLNNARGSPWFFYSSAPNGGILSRSWLGKTWQKLLKAFKIEPRPLYSTRHTYASLAIAAGEDPLWVAKILGHSRPDQLFLKYASHMEGIKKDGHKVVELILGKQSLMRALP